MPAWRRYWPIVALALLPLIPLWRAVFMGEAIGPFDQIRQMSPWNGPKPAQAWDVLQADGVLQFYVWRDLVFDAWRHWQLPLWNHYQLAGTPLLANSQSGGFYPPHILLGLLQVPTATAMTFLAWLHLFWAGLGVFVLCRAFGCCRLGAFVGGASFSLSTFMIAWTGLPSVIETVSWIPWVLALIYLIFDRSPVVKRIRAAATTPKPEDAIALQMARMREYGRPGLLSQALAVCIAMMILAGHLQFVAFGGIAALVFSLWLLFTRRESRAIEDFKVEYANSPEIPDEALRRKVFRSTGGKSTSCRQILVAVFAGFCIAAPQLLPVLAFSQFSHRKNTPTDAGYVAYNAGSIQPYELVKMVLPTIQGNPRQVASDQLPISTYYPALLKPGANFAESAIGIGAFGLMLLCILPLVAKRTDPVWGVLIVGLLGFLMAMGTPLNRLFYFGVPGWSSTGSPGRAICLFVLAACVGAGVAASRLVQVKPISTEVPPKPPKVAAALLAFAAICVVCAMLKNSYELRAGLNPELVDTLKSQAESAALGGGVGIVLLGLAAIAFAVWEQTPRSTVALAAMPVLGCLAFFGTSLIQTGQPNLRVEGPPQGRRIAPINGAWDILQAVQATLPPNLSALNRIHSLDGYDSLMHRDTVALLKDIDGEDPAPPANGNMMFIKPKANMVKLADAGVTEVWSREEMPELGEGRHEDNLYKYSLPGPGRAGTPAGPAEIRRETASQMVLRATGPGKLVIRERNMPGWIAKVNGTHVPMGGSTWMEIELPAGEANVELNYVPPGLMTGIFLAVLGWIVALAPVLGYAISRRTKRKAVLPLGTIG